MFTGIVEEKGTVRRLERAESSAVLAVHGPLVCGDAVHGASIAVNGVCLTVVDVADGVFTAEVMNRTLELTGLGSLGVGDRVNLERAMAAGGRFGGHVVQGHVDGTAQVLAREPGEAWEVVTLELPAHLARYVVAQGSITLDGVSLTVAHRGADTFAVSLIPTTLAVTALGERAVGQRVNVEVDVIAKYVESMLAQREGGR